VTVDGSTTQFVLATANVDKAREIERILHSAGAPFTLVPRPAHVPEVDETGATLEANARLKAVALASATGIPAIADDTGLEVDLLDGAPGVCSARFAGPDATYANNCALLLERLAGADAGARTARFVTVALAAWPDGHEVAAIGVVAGTIASEPKGDGGFGYDPVFVPAEGDGRTFAEMSADEKHAISHRGRAFRTLAEGLLMLSRVGD
jgi:XTP/dITP diphosphohydrolase